MPLRKSRRYYYTLLHELGHTELTTTIEAFVNLIKTIPPK